MVRAAAKRENIVVSQVGPAGRFLERFSIVVRNVNRSLIRLSGEDRITPSQQRHEMVRAGDRFNNGLSKLILKVGIGMDRGDAMALLA